jgi:hypothetical protein
MELLKILNQLLLLIPSLMRIISHYKEISESGQYTPEDREKAKSLLESLRWKPFDEVK